MGLPEDWLKDGVKGFLSQQEEVIEHSIPELDNLTSLRIIWPSAAYLLAMKCVAARTNENLSDGEDVKFLVKLLGPHREEDVLEKVGQFYPLNRLHVKTRYFIREIIADQKGREGAILP